MVIYSVCSFVKLVFPDLIFVFVYIFGCKTKGSESASCKIVKMMLYDVQVFNVFFLFSQPVDDHHICSFDEKSQLPIGESNHSTHSFTSTSELNSIKNLVLFNTPITNFNKDSVRLAVNKFVTIKS